MKSGKPNSTAIMRRLAVWLLVLTGSKCSVSSDKQCLTANLPTFEEYPVKSIWKGKPAAPLFNTKFHHEYRTTIKYVVHKGVNYAGHYIVVSWGYGTGVKAFVIVDAMNGRIYDPPWKDINFHYERDPYHLPPHCYRDLLNYTKNSRLLIVEGCLMGDPCGRSFFLFDQGDFTRVKFDPDP